MSFDVAVDESAAVVVSESQNLWPFLLYGISVVGLLAATLVASWFWGARTRHTDSTDTPFESGVIPVGSADQTRLSIEFYLIAMFFVIFDLETIFIFAWAVAFFELGWQGYFGAAAFIVILLAALVYEWRTGALDWGVLRRRSRRDYSIAGETAT
ncbi:MAG: NADH-quinone oxidoreductase subunit A [Pseudomonadales bacterium]